MGAAALYNLALRSSDSGLHQNIFTIVSPTGELFSL